MAGLADEVPVVTKVGEDFEEDFGWELENCPIQVRYGEWRLEHECSLPLIWACWVRRETAAVRLSGLGGILIEGDVRDLKEISVTKDQLE